MATIIRGIIHKVRKPTDKCSNIEKVRRSDRQILFSKITQRMCGIKYIFIIQKSIQQTVGKKKFANL